MASLIQSTALFFCPEGGVGRKPQVLFSRKTSPLDIRTMPHVFSHLRPPRGTLSFSDTETDEVVAISDTERDEVVASEVAPDSPESLQAAVSPDVIEHALSESCSPPGTFDSPRHRKQKLDHLCRHSIPDYQVRPVPSRASSSRFAAMETDTSLPKVGALSCLWV